MLRTGSVQLDASVPERLQDEVVKNLFWVDEGFDSLGFAPGQDDVLTFSYAPTPATLASRRDTDYVVRTLKETADRLIRSLLLIPVKTVFESPYTDPPGCIKPYEALCQKDWVRPLGAGVHAYSGLMSDLYHTLDGIFKEVALAHGVDEWTFPTLLGMDVMHKSGYLEGFPHQANFVCHLPEHAEAVEQVKKTVREAPEDAAENVGHALTPPGYALSPTVCYHFYKSLEGERLQGAIVGATAQGACFRYEGRAQQGLRRLREFNMREIMYVGEARAVERLRDGLLTVLQEMLMLCALQGTIQTASDPFFLDEYDKKRLFQLSFDLKHEAQAYLPDDEAWLAVGSVNYHQDHFGKAFNITLENGDPAHSCCLGFGLDRWCIAIFAQYGLDLTHWPQALRRRVIDYQNNPA